MNWQEPYVVSQSLTLQITRSGKLAGNNSHSRLPQEVELDAMPVMQCFATPRSPQEALAKLKETWELEDEGFQIVVESLIEQNFLTPIRKDAATASLAPLGFGGVLPHHYMLRDNYRVMSYKSAISAHVAGKSVVEIGCGSGILSLFAAKAGATKVTAIEESAIAALAREMFEANGCASRIDLRLGNSRDIQLSEPADVIIHEIIGVDPFGENVLPYIADARERMLRKGGRLIPHRLEVFCIGIEVEDKPHHDLDRCLAEAAQFSGMYGLDFTPFTRRLSQVSPRLLRPPVDAFENSSLKARVLSDECRLLDIDLHGDWSRHADEPSTVTLSINDAGSLGALIVYFKAHLDETTVVSNGPFVPATSWGRDVRELSERVPVQRGDEIPLAVALRTVVGRQALSVDLA